MPTRKWNLSGESSTRSEHKTHQSTAGRVQDSFSRRSGYPLRSARSLRESMKAFRAIEWSLAVGAMLAIQGASRVAPRGRQWGLATRTMMVDHDKVQKSRKHSQRNQHTDQRISILWPPSHRGKGAKQCQSCKSQPEIQLLKAHAPNLFGKVPDLIGRKCLLFPERLSAATGPTTRSAGFPFPATMPFAGRGNIGGRRGLLASRLVGS